MLEVRDSRPLFRYSIANFRAASRRGRLRFDCTPKGLLFGLPVNGKKVQFAENVFYDFLDGQIADVWSIIDKAAIPSQL